HCTVEVANALRRLHLRTKQAGSRDLKRSLENFLELGPIALPSELVVLEVVRFADRLTAYDVVYVALAKLLGLPLCTFDAGQAEVARRQRVRLVPPERQAIVDWLQAGQA